MDVAGDGPASCRAGWPVARPGAVPSPAATTAPSRTQPAAAVTARNLSREHILIFCGRRTCCRRRRASAGACDPWRVSTWARRGTLCRIDSRGRNTAKTLPDLPVRLIRFCPVRPEPAGYVPVAAADPNARRVARCRDVPIGISSPRRHSRSLLGEPWPKSPGVACRSLPMSGSAQIRTAISRVMGCAQIIPNSSNRAACVWRYRKSGLPWPTHCPLITEWSHDDYGGYARRSYRRVDQTAPAKRVAARDRGLCMATNLGG